MCTIITRGLHILNPGFESQKHFFQGGFFQKILPLCKVSRAGYDGARTI